ncbi:MAG: YceI family protein [Actinoallomurus sp.]
MKQTPGRYEIDPERSTVTFRTRHLFGLAPVRGTVAVRAGTVEVAEPITASGVRVEIDAASFSTGNALRDGNVRSARFLDTARHPVMTFVSEHLDGDVLTGTLTVRGVSRPVRLTIEESASAPLSVHATTTVDRVAFGLTASRGMTGRHLRLDIHVTARG